ncbi:MAG: hypothetical protein JWR24_482 [Actinoallomurus sp.]|nr:hypothetical protein [Actinoallomurus sp.]
MKVIQIAEDPGAEGRLSEDRVGISGNMAWVLDGASDFRNERNLPAASNVHWLVDRVHEAIKACGVGRRYGSAAPLLYDLQEEIKKELAEFDLREMQQHPCCSLSLLIENDQNVEVSRVGDAVGFLCGKSSEQLIATDFFDQREATAVAVAKAENLLQDQVTMAMYRRRSEYIRGINEESVFSGHPDGNLFVHTFVTQRRGEFQFALVCTDGLARAVTEYEIFTDWRELLECSVEHGLDHIIDEVRAHERTAQRTNQTKFKKSDDIAAILVEL